MTWLSCLYIALALLSAVMWLVAATVRIPKTAWLEAGAGGGRPSPEFDAILKKLRLQSRLNAAAAVLMAISVLVQLVQFVAAPGAP
jgi:hypothetical protein